MESRCESGDIGSGCALRDCGGPPVESSSILQGSQPIGVTKKTAEMEFVEEAQLACDVLDLEVAVEEQLHSLLV